MLISISSEKCLSIDGFLTRGGHKQEKDLDKTIQILEAEIVELEDPSTSCHSEPANPVNVEENVDKDNSNVET